MRQKTTKKEKKSELKSALLNEGGAQDSQVDNQMMKDLKDRMSSAHRRMSAANQPKSGINLGVLNPMKGLQKAQQGREKIQACMTAKRVFLMYGIIDIVLLVIITAFTYAYNKNSAFIGLIMIYVPNVILFIVVLFADSMTTRSYYQKWLRFKLVFMGFLLPLIALHQAEEHWEASICSVQLQKYNYNISKDEVQAIINDKDFSLLMSTDGMKLGEYKKQSQIKDQQPKSGEFTFTDMGKKAGNALSKISSMATAETFEELNEEQMKMRYIQFCGTSVVLGSLAVIVIYQMFQGHQYFVARERHLEVLKAGDDVNKQMNKLNVIHEEKMVKFEAGDPDFLLKELQAAANALGKQVELRKQKSLSYSDAPAYTTAIN